MVSGGGQKASGSGSTGPVTSLSFVPALLANAFFGSGIGLDKGGFLMTGTGDYTSRGQLKGGRNSSLIDPYGLNQILNRPSILGNASGVNTTDANDPFTNITGGGGNFFTNLLGGTFGLSGGLQDGRTNLNPFTTFDQLKADTQTNKLLGLSPELSGAGGTEGGLGGSAGVLNPFDLLSNIMDLVDPGINPGVGGALQGLAASDLGGLLGNQLLLGDIGPTLQEGLQTGFKPDLQPIINEASRAFFGEIVPQLGQSNVAMQEGVGPFSTDLNAALTNAGGTLASQLGALEVENQNRAADRRGEMLGLSGLITDQLFNASTDAARNRLDLGEQLAMMGTRGGRQSQLLQLLAGMTPAGPIQASSSQNSSKGAQGGIL